MLDYTQLFNLTGRTAIVTGGAGILGQHFCQALTQYGANVVVVDKQKAAAEEIAHQLSGNPSAFGIDITQEGDITQLLKNVTDHYGRVDILHNNAACKPQQLERFFDPVESFDMDIWQEVMDVNVNALFMMAKHIGGYMANNAGGSIIQTASIYGILGPDQRIYEGSEYMGNAINTPPVYSASKASVVGLTKYLATYWGDKAVRVNTLTPGGVESGQNDTFKERYSARIPMQRMAQPQEIFEASDL